MKYIKPVNNEPDTLKLYRETTPNASFGGFIDTNQKLKKALLKKQGWICAYCMQRISLKLNTNNKPKIEVEHFLPQDPEKGYSDKTLDYENMLGVCNGNNGGIEHCDKSKKSNLLSKLTPFKIDCESLITYSSNGLIKSNSNNTIVNNDINSILNLNNQNLIDIRRNVIDLAINNMDKKYPNRRWSQKNFEDEIEIYKKTDSKGKYKQFCNFVIWYLSKLREKPKYQ